ncbi:DUF3144 domain-containing protein [Asticcacaulis sp. AND118]|uniref:DUF3144 domain-containing protein n=1 Tax=Asticcacaulis sp. AND118 TaxID=2840468 RepID=UPI001CFF982F|nr:DUF3144 domain-containing protein [Asticcacaulis sp. AND118]UDF04172.1 DUF3144 domain-containing protein [Asticcacaulis sp. AND118]
MTTHTVPVEVFRQMAADHIDLTNKHANDTNIGEAGGAALQGAARYAAFTCAAQSADKTQFLAARKLNVDQLTAQFRDLLLAHYDEFGDNYETYMGSKT